MTRQAAASPELVRYEHVIGGQRVPPATGAYFPSENPYSGQAWAEIARGDAADVDRAVAAASAAFPGWSKRKPGERGRLLCRAFRAAEAIQAGTIWINTYRALSYTSPFGGYKRSGLGREGGLEALREYVQTKSVWISTKPDKSYPFVMK